MSLDKDIVLIMPPVVEGFVMANPSLGLAYLAAILEPAYSVDVFDYNIDKNFNPHDIIEDILTTHKPKVIGLSLTTLNVPQAEKIVEIILQQDERPILIAGGPHATAVTEETLAIGFDYLVIGEGDNTILELMDFIFGRSSFDKIDDIDGLAFKRDGGVVYTGKREMTDMSKLPLPAWHYFDLDKYSSVAVKNKRCMPIMASRGCPDLCKFCYKGVFGAKLRVREPESLVEEILYLKENFKIDEFVFLDENITTKKDFILKFCDLLIEKEVNLPWFLGSGVRVDRVDDEIVGAMKRAGCYRTSLGVESGNEQILKDMGKKITKDQVRNAVALFKKHRYELTLYFLLGYPTETKETAQDTINFAIELNPDLAQFPVLTPFPGSEVHEYLKSKDLLIGSNWGDYNTFIPNANPTFKHPNLTWEEILELKRKAYKSFYFRPGYAFSQIINIRSISDVRRLWKMVFSFLGFLKSS
ncbi:MAG: B12-binding domain-containing radical SAM protein [Oscillospiraceae bacterium]|nr:B12-binding domain-containing radical SAM protein [Oscillospiraceae bacterium]